MRVETKSQWIINSTWTLEQLSVDWVVIKAKHRHKSKTSLTRINVKLKWLLTVYRALTRRLGVCQFTLHVPSMVPSMTLFKVQSLKSFLVGEQVAKILLGRMEQVAQCPLWSHHYPWVGRKWLKIWVEVLSKWLNGLKWGWECWVSGWNVLLGSMEQVAVL